MYYSLMIAWYKRAKMRMKELNLTQQDVADELGLTRVSVNHRLTGRRKESPSKKELAAWAKVLKTSILWLEYGSDAKLPDIQEGQNFQAAPPLSSYLPVIRWDETDNWKKMEKKYPFTQVMESLAYAGTRIPYAYALKIEGDSMEAQHGVSFPANMYIVIDPNNTPINGSFVIVKLPNHKSAMLRQLVVEGGQQLLKALNPRYPIIEMTKNTIICGVVVQAIQKF